MTIVYPADCDSASESIKVEGSTASYFENGYVGIGTNNPSVHLHVREASVSRAMIESTGASSFAGLNFKNEDQTWLIQVQGTDEHKLYIYDETNSEPRIVIDTDGNVGIGITNPSARLEVIWGGEGSGDVFKVIRSNTRLLVDEEGYVGIGITSCTTDSELELGPGASIAFQGSGVINFGGTDAGIHGVNSEGRILLTGNIGIGAQSFGTNAERVLGIQNGTAPTSSPANMAQLWSEDVDSGKAALHLRNEVGGNGVVANIITKTTTGDPTENYEGLICINTLDNTVKIYADGGWRTIASGW